MNPKTKGVLHIIAGMAAMPITVTFLPSPWDVIIGSIWAGIVAAAAFADQSISNQ